MFLPVVQNPFSPPPNLSILLRRCRYFKILAAILDDKYQKRILGSGSVGTVIQYLADNILAATVNRVHNRLCGVCSRSEYVQKHINSV